MSKSNSAPSPSVLPQWTTLPSLHESYTSTRGNGCLMLKNCMWRGMGMLACTLVLGSGYLIYVLWYMSFGDTYYHTHVFKKISRLQKDTCFNFHIMNSIYLYLKEKLISSYMGYSNVFGYHFLITEERELL